jgi:hypothetical protein
MSRYDSFKAALQRGYSSHEDFTNRGRNFVAYVLTEFVRYLEAPQGTCTACRLGDLFDSPSRVPLNHMAELQEDGWFAAGLWVSDGEPHGMQLRLEFYARLDGDTVILRAQDSKEFRVESLVAASLAPLFDHVINENMAFLNTKPERLARGERGRQIGFTASLE